MPMTTRYTSEKDYEQAREEKPRLVQGQLSLSECEQFVALIT